MDSLTTKQSSSQRLLLNAESFGYGPSAVVASIFPFLRERFDTIGFVGARQGMDIQRALPYDHIFDLTGLRGEPFDRAFREVLGDFDIFFTAMDFPLLEKAAERGLRTCGFDALTWFWRQLPPGAAIADRYLAQNFIGVPEVLATWSNELKAPYIVPPLVSREDPARNRSLVLINFGGLQNPFWSLEEATRYAEKMIQALRNVIPEDQEVVLATSEAICKRLGEGARTYSREEMKEILRSTKYAFMTPGLGNVYDVAVHSIPTVWIPPANDSQGQQLNLLAQHGFVNRFVSWGDVLPEGDLDYWDSQAAVLRTLVSAVDALNLNTLASAVQQQLEKLLTDPTCSEAQLLEKFGCDGQQQVADHLIDLSLNSFFRRT